MRWLRVEAFGFGIWAEVMKKMTGAGRCPPLFSRLLLGAAHHSLSLSSSLFANERNGHIQYNMYFLVVIPGHGGGSNGSAFNNKEGIKSR